MLLEYSTSALIGTALRSYIKHSKAEESYRLSVNSSEKIAKAELEIEKHQHMTEQELEKLFSRIGGIINYLEGPFTELMRPFENETHSLKTGLLEDLVGSDVSRNLTLITAFRASIIQRPEVKSYMGSGEIGGIKATTANILFGDLGVKSQNLNAIKAQSSKANLLVTHMEVFCTALDLQREQYHRVSQVLGALNIALIPTLKHTSEGFQKFSWMLDADGHLPDSITVSQLKSCMELQDLNNLANCINIARCIYALLAEPLFDQDATLTKKAQDLLNEGQDALNKIKMIESRRKNR